MYWVLLIEQVFILTLMEKEYFEEFGLAVVELRNSRKYTQEDLADRAKLHINYISLVERGKAFPSLSKIYMILGAFDLDFIEFFTEFNMIFLQKYPTANLKDPRAWYRPKVKMKKKKKK